MAGVALWRRLAIVGLLGFVVVTAGWAFRPWTSAVSLPAVGNNTGQAVFRCGAVFDGDSIARSNQVAPSETALPRQPCTTRNARRALAVADLVVGSVALVGLVAVKRPQPASDLNGGVR